MTPDQLAALEHRANMATPGPWSTAQPVPDADGPLFIAAASPDVVLHLIAEIRRLQLDKGAQ